MAAASLDSGQILASAGRLLSIPDVLFLRGGGGAQLVTMAVPLLLSRLIALLEIGVRAGVHAFSSAGWTLTHLERARLEQMPAPLLPVEKRDRER